MIAIAAGGIEPRHVDPVAFLHMGDACAHLTGKAQAFMARNEWGGLYGSIAFGGVKIGMADAGRLHRHLNLAGASLWHGDFIDDEWFAEFANHGSFHGL